jgi:hypothetical protein
MLEGAQRTITDLKASSGRESRSSGSNIDEVKLTILNLKVCDEFRGFYASTHHVESVVYNKQFN